MADTLMTLSNTPVEAWQGLIGAIAGGLLTFIAVSQTNKSNRESQQLQLELQRQQHHRERLEELYILVSEWSHGIRNSNAHMSLLMQGLIHPQEYLDSINAPENEVDFNRVEMLVGIYGDSVKTAFKEVLTIRDDMSKVLGLCFDSLKNGSPNPTLITEIVAKEPLFNESMKRLQSAIVKAAKEV